MRVLITGGAGTLGAALARRAPAGAEVHVTVRAHPAPAGEPHRVDLADAAAVRELFARIRPAMVIHTAYDPHDLEGGVVRASEAVAAACREVAAGLVHLSSDRVLSGERAPYDEDAPAEPVEPYGEAKAEAERLVHAHVPDAAIIRTSLIVATDPPDRISASVVDGLRAGGPVSLFVDELRCPIHVDDLAAQLWAVAALPSRRGVWNLVGPEAMSRFALGTLVARRWGVDPAGLVPALNREHASRRPRDLRLTTARADAELPVHARPISEALFG